MSAQKKLIRKLKAALEKEPVPPRAEERAGALEALHEAGVKLSGKQARRLILTGRL